MRCALVNQYMSGMSVLPWFRPGSGDTMATADHRDIDLIVDVDPYAYKGMVG